MLPINDPEIEVFVLLDDPRWIHDYASQVVAPVVGNIISEVAPYLGIEQDANYNPTGNVTVQTCLDYTWTNAQVTLNQLGLQHKLIGSNGNIVYQYPVGGSSVPVGSTIYLYTNTDQDAMTTVPDVTGKSGSFASQMLKASNLNVQFEGDQLRPGSIPKHSRRDQRRLRHHRDPDDGIGRQRYRRYDGHHRYPG